VSDTSLTASSAHTVVHAPATIPVWSPVTRTVLAQVPNCSPDAVNAAVDTASRAQPAWWARPAIERAQVLRALAELLKAHQQEFEHLLGQEIAKNRRDAGEEVARSADYCLYTAEEGLRLHGEALFADSFPGQPRDKVSIVRRVPLGVVLAISPFNYPLNLAVTKIAPALMAGNAVVFKPATQGSLTGLRLADLCYEAGVPREVLQVVTGSGSHIGDHLAAHPGINMIAFTGSTATGQRIARHAGMIPLSLELGGKDAAIVLEDADLDRAAAQIVNGAFAYAGQRCTAVKRVLVVDTVADALVERVGALTRRLAVGRPEDDAPITPLISDAAADHVASLIDEAVEAGASAITPIRREGNLLWPVVLDHVTPSMPIAWVEPFGPVLPVLRVHSEAEAVDLANRSEYGLQAAIFTRDVSRAVRLADRLAVGTVQINGKTSRGPDHFPFVGTKSSGLGAQGVRYALEAMTRLSSVVMHLD
jgi:glyceraldehyde-3-phosphate dehydrogenase (NADP+)